MPLFSVIADMIETANDLWNRFEAVCTLYRINICIVLLHYLTFIEPTAQQSLYVNWFGSLYDLQYV